MIDKQPSKRSRTSLDMGGLSPDDRRALERAAKILNRPLSELCEDNAQHTSVGPRTTVVDPLPGGDTVYAGTQPWLLNHWQDADVPWQHDFSVSGMDKQISQPNGLLNTMGLMFDGTEDNVYQWSERNDQGTPSNLLNRGSTPSVDNQSWFSVPTEYLTQAYQEHEINAGTGAGTSSARTGMPSKSSAQEANTVDASDSDVVELGWVDLKTPQHSRLGSMGEVTTSEWSMIELANRQESFHADEVNPKCMTWVPADSTGKELSPKKKRGPFQDPQLREQTSDTRKLKACVRCRMQKIRVSITQQPSSISI